MSFDIENSNLTTDRTTSLLDKYMDVYFKYEFKKILKLENSIAKDKV